uniref:N-acetyltransferase domain-containing protein n=1 Tax=Chromera velia CCMP2878 TaxID=1169474 RepID=A0A0G4F4X4_9ALVE|eukprot:Cvel_2739.t1-p1 / transcript=Cvel_2739.t1 / gene=Cvel_2739 / organism=Chromera_velia_CCMP2878 / gene_product=N-acetyltransferase 9-like protein, putative / transcript_product=N-acetyltransferase 9-like protein, putative / location=Cvel_scaffold110:472-4500(-) / protein_length=217 / sequence_SO=supercontig / SO=protein_coding / is_pseudo=false
MSSQPSPPPTVASLRALKLETFEGERLRLIPYIREAVPLYNQWMKDPHLQEMTASEPQSLEEEYEVREIWLTQDDRISWLILDRSLPASLECPEAAGGALAGDVGCVFDEGDFSTGELLVMIAEDRSRRKGLAVEALQIIMRVLTERIGTQKFTASISSKNAESVALFLKLGFEKTGFKEAFDEHVLEKIVEKNLQDPSAAEVLPRDDRVRPDFFSF